MLVHATALLAYVLSILAIVLWMPALLLVLAVTLPFDRNRRVAGRFLRFLAVFIAHTFPYWKVRVEGRWPAGKGAYVVVSNHQSMLDIFLISHLPREMKWIGKESLFKIPWAGWMLRLSGDIPVKRGDAASGKEVMAKARRYLDRGMHVMIFPEGTRTRTGKLLPFKSGAFRLAIEAGVPVLPIAVSGTAEGMPADGPWVRPASPTARILAPIPTAGMGPGDVARLRDLARARIAEALGETVTAQGPEGAGDSSRAG
ncbi:lysophospholipid acyltransferase family protein [Anaeromyxobacter paludicola]|uniref:1-acyl-sn-glycerol-3-phosphate acyltransferase n=1 Tax=Anaeromyxobacter paludicola TaxID=2918171 RepID=A0ABM7XBD5_9BACT|nr:lysophospholipid acyltransferase family protein [Anaeromyxobacter paludicola]BDG09176.1 hypothetical protein AMPC_22890 [Anaeromyxobacter paludicola]